MKRRTQVGKELDTFHHTSSAYSVPCHDILMWNITAGSAALSGTANTYYASPTVYGVKSVMYCESQNIR